MWKIWINVKNLMFSWSLAESPDQYTYIELVMNRTTGSFLLAIRWFLDQRLNSKIIYSSNAKTSKKVKKQIENLYDVLSSYLKYFAKERIVWKNNIEGAAWWGGFYECFVKKIKGKLFSLQKILQKKLLERLFWAIKKCWHN